MTAVPREIRLTEGARRLHVLWDDDAVSDLAADTLRRHSRSAGSVRAAFDGIAPVVPPDLAIRDVRLVGAYAVNLVFSDGHDRGIYPWSYLRALAAPVEARG